MLLRSLAAFVLVLTVAALSWAGTVYRVTSTDGDKPMSYEVRFGGGRAFGMLTGFDPAGKRFVYLKWNRRSESEPKPVAQIWDHRTGATIPLYKFPDVAQRVGCIAEVFLVVCHGDDEGVPAVAVSVQLLDHFKAVHSRKIKVEENDIRMLDAGHGNRLGTALGGLDVAARSTKQCSPLAGLFLIMGSDQNPQGSRTCADGHGAHSFGAGDSRQAFPDVSFSTNGRDGNGGEPKRRILACRNDAGIAR